MNIQYLRCDPHLLALADTAWDTGKTPNIFEASAAGLVEVLKSSIDPEHVEEFNIWQPWPVEYFLEPYLEEQWLENKGDFIENTTDPCA